MSKAAPLQQGRMLTVRQDDRSNVLRAIVMHCCKTTATQRCCKSNMTQSNMVHMHHDTAKEYDKNNTV